MELELGDICTIQPGVYMRSSERNKDSAVFVNLRDFNENLEFTEAETFVDLKEVKDKYIIKEKDLLFSTRLKFNAYQFPNSRNESYVASNSFAILRLKNRKILTEYLKWYLNHSDREAFFALSAQGTARVPYISIKKLAKMKIDLPDLDTQKLIVSVSSLMEREKSLTQTILDKKEIYIQNLLSNTIGK